MFFQPARVADHCVAVAAGSQPITTLLISPWEEQRFSRARYEALARDLEALGFDVELEEPPTHSADAMDPVDVALYVGNLLATGLASALTTALVARLSEKRDDEREGADDEWPASRTVYIYGPDEEVLAQLEIPERDV